MNYSTKTYITIAKLKSPLLSTPKRKLKRQKKAKESLIPPPEDEVLDEDAIFKIFFTQNVANVVAIANPPLFKAVDWSVEVEFCEQELINFLRGRLRQKDKRKVADKLLKLKLLSGEDIFVFFHNEFQNALSDDLAKRWFTSRMLISLRYNVEDITTLIIFTGDPPLKKHSFYDRTCFGTRTTFKANPFVVVKQNAKQLMAMNNPAAFAFLAAKYAVQSKNDMKKRFFLKKKVFDLVKERGFSEEILENVLTFVFDYMLLPQKMEEEFLVEVPFFQSLKSENTMMTRGAALISNVMCINKTGMNFNDYADFRTAEVEALKAEVEIEKKAAKEAAKEAAKARNIQIIHAMLEDGFPIERIAHILKIDVDYANELAKMTV